MSDAADQTCRLCHGSVVLAFSATIMEKLQIAYYRCEACGSLQTETPYWLEEAYGSHLGHLDLGAVQRNLANQAVCYLVSRLWKLRDALDYGGGDGLLCRMVREHGVNCFVFDKYGQPTYAQTFTQPDFDRPEMIFSFEVFEHFSNPGQEFMGVFGKGAALILASTGLYRGQGSDWFYLSLASGRHVFFYSPEAIHQIAKRYGYVATIAGPYVLFTQPAQTRRVALAIFRLFTGRAPLRLLRAYLSLLRARGVEADAETMRRRTLQDKERGRLAG